MHCGMKLTLHSKKETTLYMSDTPLDDFFAQYPRFRYNNTAPEAKVSLREEYKDALTKQFNTIYGTDLNDWDAWRHMCQMVNISPVPDTLEACREVCAIQC
ncbi:hypothetical protein BDQ17DRAFT_1373689 [Cyathus striatus]|nr:hypothetical protein BDQ17DRAFT_1373689 [Cyathus striatus]